MSFDEQKFKKRARLAIALAVIALLILLLYTAFTTARYLSDRVSENATHSDEFYFTSDLLDNSSDVALVYLSGTTDPRTATITLRNHDDMLRYSQVDIPYTLTLTQTDDATKVITKKGTITSGEPGDAAITLSTAESSGTSIVSGKKYSAKAIANSTGSDGTYQKKLTRTILFSEPDASFHASTEVHDNGAYVDVSVWNTGNSNTTFTINFPSTLTPDNSDPYMASWTKTSGAHVIAENECHVFRFFKSEETVIEQDEVQNATTANAYVTLKDHSANWAVLTDDGTLTFDYFSKDPNVGDSYTTGTIQKVYKQSAWGSHAWTSDNSSIPITKVNFNTNTVAPTSLNAWFANLGSLTTVDNASRLDTSQVTNMASMFSNDSVLNSIDVSAWDTSKVTTFDYTFFCCGALTSVNVSNWDTSNATNFHCMFQSSGIISLDLSKWNTSKVTTTRCMFMVCTSLTSVNLSGWDTSNMTTTARMFTNCEKLTTLDLSSFNTSKDTDTQIMFSGCSQLQTIYIGDGWDMSKVTSSNNMFGNCTNLSGKNVGGVSFADKKSTGITYAKAPDGYLTFHETDWAVITQNDDNTTYSLSFIDTGESSAAPTAYKGKAVVASYAPSDWKITYSTVTTSSLANTMAAADDTPAQLESAGAQLEATTEKLESADAQLEATTEKLEGAWAEYLSKITTVNFDTAIKPTDTSYWFYNATSLANVFQTQNLNLASVSNTSYMFNGCSALTGLDVSAFDMSNVTNARNMFYGCSNITSLDVSKWNTSKMENIARIFQGTGITSIDVSSWDTSKLTMTVATFMSCNSLTEIDLSKWTVPELQNSWGMFAHCQQLKTVDLAKWETSKLYNTALMFKDAPELETIYIGDGWTTSAVTSGETMFVDNKKLSGKNKGGVSYTAMYAIDQTTATNETYAKAPDGYLTLRDANWAVLTEDGTLAFDYFHIDPVVGNTYNGSKITNIYKGEGGWQTGTVSWSSQAASIKTVAFNAIAKPSKTAYWFCNTTALTTVTNPENLDTSNVTDMSFMFGNAGSTMSLTSLDASTWNTSKVTNMQGMFNSCKSLTSVNLSGWDTSNVTNMRRMFTNCNSLTEIDASGFNTAKVKDMEYMFWNCSNLRTIYAGPEWSTISISGYDQGHNLFLNDNKLVGGKGTKYSDAKQTEANYAVIDQGPDSSSPGYLTLKDANWAVYTADGTLTFTYFAKDPVVGTTKYNGQTVTAAYSLTETDWDSNHKWTEKAGTTTTINFANPTYPTTTANWFGKLDVTSKQFTALTEVRNADNLYTDNVTSMQEMFEGCKKLASIDVSKWNISKCTNFERTFEHCESLEVLDVSDWKLSTTSNVNLTCLFSSCTALKTIDVSQWDTSMVNSLWGTFRHCESVTELDLSGWYLPQSPRMTYLFKGCSSLKTIYASASTVPLGDTDAYSSMQDVFGNADEPCPVLVGGAGTAWSSDHVDGTYACIDGGFETYTGEQATTAQTGYLTAKNANWAVYTDDNKTLSFIYSVNKPTEYNGYTVTKAYDLSTSDWDSKHEWSEYLTSITTVDFVDPVYPTTTSGWFQGTLESGKTPTLKTVSHPANLKTDNVTSMNCMFSCCTSLESFDVSSWNTSKVQNMGFLFDGCWGANFTSLDLSNWDTSSLLTCVGMFENAQHLTTITGLDKLNMSKVTTTQVMFYGCNALTEANVSTWDTSSVTTMKSMFTNCSSLTSLDMRNWNTSNVTDMSYLFYGCKAITAFELGNWNTSKVTDMTYLFNNCAALTTLDLSTWNTAKVTTMNSMISACTALKTVDISSFSSAALTDMQAMFSGDAALGYVNFPVSFTASKVTNFANLFNSCNSLVTIDMSSFTTANTADITNMFKHCYALTTIYAGSAWNNTNMTEKWRSNDNATFRYCYLLVGGNGTKFSNEHNDRTYARLDGGPDSSTPGYFTLHDANYAVYTEDGTLTFVYLTEYPTVGTTKYGGQTITAVYPLTEYNWDVNHKWTEKADTTTTVNFANIVHPTTTANWFSGYSALTSVNQTNHLDTSQVATMESMFNGCSVLTDLDLSTHDFGKVANMDSLFNGCSVLANLTLPENFVTSSVTNLHQTFKDCAALASLDTGKWDTSNVTTMESLFQGCSSLASVDVAEWDVSKVTNMHALFVSTALTVLDICGWNTSNVSNFQAMFGYCNSLTTIYAGPGWTTAALSEGAPNLFNGAAMTKLKGGAGTTWNKDNIGRGYACIDGGYVTNTGEISTEKQKGYFTAHEANWAVLTENGTLAFDYFHSGSDPAVGDTYKGSKITNVYPSSDWISRTDGATAWKDEKSSITAVSFNTLTKPTSTKNWFNGCPLTSVNNVINLDTSNVTDMSYMFTGCSALTTLDVSRFDTSSVTTMEHTFSSCSGLTTLDLSRFDTTNVTNMNGLFLGCSGLTSLDVTKFDTANVKNMSYMFDGCSGLTSLDVTSFDTANVTNMSYMFRNCSALTSLDVSKFDTAKVTTMDYMFENCTVLKALDISSFDSTVLTSMAAMFEFDYALESISFSQSFKALSVTSFANTFSFCKALKTLDISSFETANNADLTNMFKNCTELTTIYAGNSWDNSNMREPHTEAQNGSFLSCNKLVGGNGTAYSAENKDKTYARIDGGPDSSTPGYFTAKEVTVSTTSVSTSSDSPTAQTESPSLASSIITFFSTLFNPQT